MAERNGFNNIIPDQEERIGRHGSDLFGESSREARGRNAQSAGMSGFWKALSMMLVLGLGAVSWLGWQQYQQLSNLQSSFDELKSRLASTDESLSQSGAVQQLKIKEQGEELTKHWAEIKKLWGISYDVNRKSISENQKTVAANKARLDKLEEGARRTAEINKQVESIRKKLAVLSGDVLANSAELEAMDVSLQEIEKATQVISLNFTNLSKDLDGRIAELEGAVKSFNLYRRQTNQELLQLRQVLSGGAGN